MRYFLLIPAFIVSIFAFASQSFTLKNGLKIIVKEDHRAPAVVTMLWYKVGSADEPKGLTGISHVIEHIMFKGTVKYPLGVFSKTIADLGGQENAMTNNDYTAFYEKIAPKDLPLALELEADRMQNLLFDETEFQKEMQVIQEERRLRIDDNPQSLSFERFLATAHLAEPYHHPVIGWMSDLKQMPLSEVKNWYKKYYAPNNAILVVVGDVEARKVLKLAQAKFGGIRDRTIPKNYIQLEPKSLGTKTVAIQANAQVPMLMLGFTVPSVTTSDNKKDPYALELIAGILSAGDSSILNTKLIRKQQIASTMDTYYNLYARFQTQFIIFGSPTQNKNLQDLQVSILEELAKIKKMPMDAKILNRVKTQIIAQKTFEKDSIFGQAMEIGLLEAIGLGTEVGEKYIERINNVTPSDIQMVAQKYFTENNMTVAKLIAGNNDL